MEKKLTRRESRETAFLTAFAATFEPEEPTVPAEEHAAPDAFANQLLAAMNDHAAELDEIITAHLKGWTLSRVPRVSLVALRLALAEMLYGDEQKPGVAINEAVELVKKYGAEDDYQFVNGLLGAVRKLVGLRGIAEELLVPFVKGFLGFILVAENLDDFLAVDHFLHVAVDRAERLLLAHEIAAALRRDLADDLEHQKQKDDDEGRKPDAEGEH